MLASAAPAIAASFGFAARYIARAAVAPNMPRSVSVRLIDSFNKELVDDIFAHALKKQTGVSLKYMLDFGANPIERQLLLSAQFLHKELPVRLAHRVAELENLPYGLSAKKAILQVRRPGVGSSLTHWDGMRVGVSRTTREQRWSRDALLGWAAAEQTQGACGLWTNCRQVAVSCGRRGLLAWSNT